MEGTWIRVKAVTSGGVPSSLGGEFGHDDLYEADECRTDPRLRAELNGDPIELTPAWYDDFIFEPHCYLPRLDREAELASSGPEGDLLAVSDGRSALTITTAFFPARKMVVLEPLDGVLKPGETAVLEWRGDGGGPLDLVDGSLSTDEPRTHHLEFERSGRRISFILPHDAIGDEARFSLRLNEEAILDRQRSYQTEPLLTATGWDHVEVDLRFEDVGFTAPLAAQ